MSDNERLIISCNYLIKNRNARSFAEIAKLCGKTPQYFTDIKANKHIVSRFFLDELCDKFPILNKNWLLTGEGKMLRTDAHGLMPENLGGDEDEEQTSALAQENALLRLQLKAKDEQIDRLLGLLDKALSK